jgi:hypothetical protein
MRAWSNSGEVYLRLKEDRGNVYLAFCDANGNISEGCILGVINDNGLELYPHVNDMGIKLAKDGYVYVNKKEVKKPDAIGVP